MTLKLGKRSARAGATRFKLADYAEAVALPTPPPQFGYAGDIGMTGWGMLANDRFGDCVWAGAAHETMLLNKIAGRTANFADANVLADYAAVTGFSASDPSTDNGTDMQVAASYRRKTGIIDSSGKRHVIAAYLALDASRIQAGDFSELYLALSLFGVVGLGLELPAAALDQTERGAMWDVVANSPIAGGHYVAGVGKLANGHVHVVSWGAIQTMTDAFLKKYCDEALAYVSQEYLIDQKSPKGFSYVDLIRDLKALS